jgi:hypothetical protein
LKQVGRAALKAAEQGQGCRVMVVEPSGDDDKVTPSYEKIVISHQGVSD